MQNRSEILERIRSNLPFGADVNLREELDLAELGVTSLHLITLIMEVQRAYGLQGGLLADEGMPETIGELISMIENGLQETDRQSATL